MRGFKIILTALFFGSILTGCFDDMDDVVRTSSTLEINNFIWRGMNDIYLYKEDVPELADDYFANQEELDDFIKGFSSPERLFYDALVAPQDDFSFLVADYIELENALEGIAVTTGMEFGLVRYPSSTSSTLLGYVRYVLPNTSADRQGIVRGHLFHAVDGQPLTDQNFRRLLEPPSYSIELATLDETGIVSTGESIALKKEQYSENPIFLSKVFNTEAGNVGYLMYNSFSGSYDSHLNSVFADFKSSGISNLVLDLRYNGGGSVESAVDLASMITGQFQGEIFSTEQWNEDYQSYLEENNPAQLVNRFNGEIRTGEAINSLGLTKVYVITTLRTASASELVINGLKPYITVVQVGERTTGKFQASITLYDSPDFRRVGANLGHTYAIQPLVYKSANAQGVTDYLDGLPPDLPVQEKYENLGIIGERTEPLLQVALNHIEGKDMQLQERPDQKIIVGESGMERPFYKRMYDEKPIQTEILPIEE